MPGEAKGGIEPVVVVLLLLLTATTGLVDAVSVLALGQVFTANMTGNVVFLGFALAGQPGFRWPLYMVALVGFALGAYAAGAMAKVRSAKRRSWLVRIAAIEAGLLSAAAGIALALGPLPRAGIALSVLAMVALMAVAMGVRNATVRAMKVPDLTTTVLTLTIAGLAADLRDGAQAMQRRLMAVAAILVGAFVGALLLHFGPAVPLLIAAAVIIGATLVLVREESAAPTDPPP